MFSTVLEATGLILIAAAAWTVGPTLGLLVTGAFLVLTGLAADRSTK
jgi:hypothetical protein